tara:strand:+ start:285 stop:548 length:264 start_codon:yes stop_codon:yes gene_type:complete
MTNSIEELKKKIIYRSSYRGTKEMDALLRSFVEKVINNLNNEDLLDLYKLLNIDDDNLYKFKCDIETSIKIPNNQISKLFKEYKFEK